MDEITLLRQFAEKYNDEKYFSSDPIIFPKHFTTLLREGKSTLKDVEIAAVIAAHLAWGRRDMIVRDCKRAMDEMNWHPYDYIMRGKIGCNDCDTVLYKKDDCSLHRTIKWCDFASICCNLRKFYESNESLSILSPDSMRTLIYGQKSDLTAANKKIHMLRRWMVRDDGKVDLGLWNVINKNDLIIPLDVHVHRSALNLNITSRKGANITTALEITEYLKQVFPGDPTLGDFALFAVAATKNMD